MLASSAQVFLFVLSQTPLSGWREMRPKTALLRKRQHRNAMEEEGRVAILVVEEMVR